MNPWPDHNSTRGFSDPLHRSRIINEFFDDDTTPQGFPKGWTDAPSHLRYIPAWQERTMLVIPDNVVVLDPDDHEDRRSGVDGLILLCKELGLPLPPKERSIKSRTGRGRHWYFHWRHDFKPPKSLGYEKYGQLDFLSKGNFAWCPPTRGYRMEKEFGVYQLPEALEKTLCNAMQNGQNGVNTVSLDGGGSKPLEWVAEMLQWVDSGDLGYEEWLRVLLSCRASCNHEGLYQLLWDWSHGARWDRGSAKFFKSIMTYEGNGNCNGITPGTLQHYAEKGGYRARRKVIWNPR